MRQNICDRTFTKEEAETAIIDYQANTNNENARTLICMFAQQCCEKSIYLKKIPENDREDICQDVIVRMLERIGEYDGKKNKEGYGTSVKAWINRMIVSICNDEFRKKTSRTGKERTIRVISSLNSVCYMENLSYEGLKSTSDTGCHKIIGICLFTGGKREEPEEAFYKKYVSENLYNVITQLPERYAKVIYLYYYDDRSVREIAERLGNSETAVKKVLDRARNKMKNYLEKYDLEIA